MPVVEWVALGDLYSGLPAKVRWHGGVLSGTPEAMAEIDLLVAFGQVALTPTGPVLRADKTDPVSAYAMALAVMRAPDVTGAPPELPVVGLPDGAIG